MEIERESTKEWIGGKAVKRLLVEPYKEVKVSNKTFFSSSFRLNKWYRYVLTQIHRHFLLVQCFNGVVLLNGNLVFVYHNCTVFTMYVLKIDYFVITKVFKRNRSFNRTTLSNVIM